jgi:acyl carrier protein
MSTTEIDQRLREILASVLEVPVEEIPADASTDTVEAWDSLAHMNLILATEDAFGVTIPDEEAADLTSLPLLQLVVRELTGAGA